MPDFIAVKHCRPRLSLGRARVKQAVQASWDGQFRREGR
jgi:hypothetical protein